jgi:hypothetical protein
MDNPKKISEKIKELTKEGDVVLIGGRVGHSLERTKQLMGLLEQ